MDGVADGEWEAAFGYADAATVVEGYEEEYAYSVVVVVVAEFAAEAAFRPPAAA